MRTRLWIPVLLLVAGLFWREFRPVQATIDPSCSGNVCSGTVTVGGQAIDYSWTQNHDEDDASLKVRFVSGPYTAGGNVSFKIEVDKAFSSNASLKNPSPATSIPPDQTVNGPRTIVERRTDDVAVGTTYDFVQELRYVSPAPDRISVTLEFAQYGFSDQVGPFDVFLDAASPSNRDEGESLDALFGPSYRQCNDAVDNDVDYRLDCADSDCAGESIGPTSVCESPETTCNDGLDNDGNGETDCADPLCNGRPGNAAETKFCGPENGGPAHANCADAFDNDGNGETDCVDDDPGTGCWKTGFQDCAASETSCVDDIDNDRDRDYDSAVDGLAGTGVDCRDYDCEGQGNCTTNERMSWDAGSGTFIDDPAQCFNGLDDDLDGDVDCGDADCLGAESGPDECASFEAYLPPSPLGDGTTLPSFYFNFCADGLDNDGNGEIDELDVACRNVFGFCGPSPAIEDYTFLSCSNTEDDDLDTAIDCVDSECRAERKIGRSGCLNATCGAPAEYDTIDTDVAVCAAGEDAANYCGDGLDNDADGAVDCADAGCAAPAQRHGPTVGSAGAPYFCGAESGDATCHDGADNDSDLGADCFDAACQDGLECRQRPGAGGWTLAASCPEVPHTTTPAPIAGGGTVDVAHDDKLYVNAPYRMRFTGTGSYTSLTIVIGDAADPANAFPFDAGTGNCALAGTGASQMQYSSPSPDAGIITEAYGETIIDFDVTLECALSSAVPLGPEDFKVSIVANRSGSVEFGESTLISQVYENTAPTLPTPAAEVEAIVGGQVDVPVGASVRLQATPDTDPSGICRCDFLLEGVYQSSPDGNCLATVGPFANDATYDVDVVAVDGASNRSATSTQQIDVNVVPSVDENLVLGTDLNGATVLTYRGTEAVNLTTKFRTDTLSTFPVASNCRVYVYDADWVGGEAATASMVPTAIGDALTCQGTYTVPAALAAGRYWIFVEATDSGGDIVRSNAQSFLKCENADVGTGACKDADFDHDGTPEGRFTPDGYPSPPTPTYLGEPQPRACDNCINFYNPNQRDENANGLGDSCEAGLIGRCKYKYCGLAPDDLTPGGACLEDADCSDGDLCVIVDQPMCTVNCAADADCQPPTTSAVGLCSLDWGVCDEGASDEGSCCFSNADCLSGKCEALVQPFLETVSGQVYSGGDIQAGETPPIHNATYCLQSGGLITNFTSELGCALPESPVYEIPKAERNYVGSFGVIDVNGILNGKYGALLQPGSVPDQLDGRIYYFPSGLTINAPIQFKNSSGASRANGLVVVKGDLIIDADLSYQDRNESDLKNLASVGWIVLKDGGSGGNVFVGPSVMSVVGAFFAEETIDTGGGTTPFEATGVFVARNFSLKREFASRTAGAERVTFDARVILNPPPGLADATRSLPGFRSTPGR